MNPGLDKGSVEFQVVAEGMRLGVGYTPARVVATVSEDGAAPARRAATGRERARFPRAGAGRTSRPEWAFSAAWTSTPVTPSALLFRRDLGLPDRAARPDDRRRSVPRERDPGPADPRNAGDDGSHTERDVGFAERDRLAGQPMTRCDAAIASSSSR